MLISKKDILLIVIHTKYSFNSNLRSYDICRYDSATTKPRIIETDVIVLNLVPKAFPLKGKSPGNEVE